MEAWIQVSNQGNAIEKWIQGPNVSDYVVPDPVVRKLQMCDVHPGLSLTKILRASLLAVLNGQPGQTICGQLFCAFSVTKRTNSLISYFCAT